jgi:hypothetical protein
LSVPVVNLDVRRFEKDLSQLTRMLSEGEEKETRERLVLAKHRLLKLRKEDRVKINHSVLELLCAKTLITKGFDVEIEHPLAHDLVCDIYGKGRGSTLIVEIETGFVPPTYALSPLSYCTARIASKMARYSRHADRFAFGTTPSNILPLPAIFQEPPGRRSAEELLKVKALCDIYYRHPPITVDQMVRAELDSIYVIDLDNLKVRELSPHAYIRSVASLPFAETVR